MLTLLLLAPPVGVVFGYVMTAIMIAQLSWQWVFYSQAGVAIVLGTITLGLVKNKYFDIEAAVLRRQV